MPSSTNKPDPGTCDRRKTSRLRTSCSLVQTACIALAPASVLSGAGFTHGRTEDNSKDSRAVHECRCIQASTYSPQCPETTVPPENKRIFMFRAWTYDSTERTGTSSALTDTLAKIERRCSSPFWSERSRAPGQAHRHKIGVGAGVRTPAPIPEPRPSRRAPAG